MPSFKICPIEEKYNVAAKDVILQVRAEFGVVNMQEGLVAPELLNLAHYYKDQYWVLIDERGKVYGGCGFSIENKEADIVKFYLLPEVRGQGWGKALLQVTLEKALELGCERAHLFTATNMQDSIALYERCGFERYEDPNCKINNAVFFGANINAALAKIANPSKRQTPPAPATLQRATSSLT